MNNRIITTLKSNAHLEYAQGRFDAWCIYVVGKNYRHAIKDVEIFNLLIECTKSVSANELYADFVDIYSKTTSVFDSNILEQIKVVSQEYKDCQNEVEYAFSFLYAGMVAEENKKNAILKKRIKRLAMHQLLIENLSPQITANYSRGKKWFWLDEECSRRGF